MHALKLEKVSKSFSNGGESYVVLNEIDFEIKKGEHVVITGDSGVGKSTLLRIMACLEVVDGGKYFLNQKLITSYSDRKKAKFRRDWIGYVPQDNKVISGASVYENIALPLYLQKWKEEEIEKSVMEMVELFDLQNIVKREGGKLSQGERQRVCIARAFVKRPQFIFADEPTASLDKKNIERLIDLLGKKKNENITVVTVTHDNSFASYFDNQFELGV